MFSFSSPLSKNFGTDNIPTSNLTSQGQLSFLTTKTTMLSHIKPTRHLVSTCQQMGAYLPTLLIGLQCYNETYMHLVKIFDKNFVSSKIKQVGCDITYNNVSILDHRWLKIGDGHNIPLTMHRQPQHDWHTNAPRQKVPIDPSHRTKARGIATTMEPMIMSSQFILPCPTMEGQKIVSSTNSFLGSNTNKAWRAHDEITSARKKDGTTPGANQPEQQHLHDQTFAPCPFHAPTLNQWKRKWHIRNQDMLH